MKDFMIEILKISLSIMVAFLPLLIPQIRKFIIKCYQLSLDKALEDKKSLNERKNYVCKVRFDKEFEIYQNLVETMLIIEKNINELYIQKDIRTIPIYNVLYVNKNMEPKELGEYIYKCENELNRQSPFIRDWFYRNYKLIISKSLYIIAKMHISKPNTNQLDECKKEIDNINCISKKTIDELRNYLDTLYTY